MAVIQLWTAMPCQSGAYALGGIPRYESASGKEARGAPSSFTLVCPRANNGAADQIAEGHILRVISGVRAEQYWLVTTVALTEGLGEGTITVTCGSIKQLLATRGLVRSQPVTGGPWNYAFTPQRQYVTDAITAYVLTNLAADDLSWWSIGTQEYAPPLKLAAFNRVRRGAVLTQIEQQTGYTFVPRLVYTGTTLTGVAIDLLEDPGASLDTRTLAVGGSITTLQGSQEYTRSPTVAVPFTASGAPMEHNAFVIGTVTGAGPYWSTLLDPDGGPNAIREDDQFIGKYLIASDGTAHTILDSRASDSAVSTTANTGLSGDGIVSICDDSAGRPLQEITSPSGLASSRGRVVAEVTTSAAHASRNFAVNPLMTDWTDAFTPAGWADEGGTFNVGEYDRTTPATVTGVLVNGAHAAGATGVNFKAAPAFARFYSNEYLFVGGAPFRVGNVVAAADGSGVGSIVFASGTLPSPVADGDPITWLGNEPKRPTAFPEEAVTTNVMRLLTASGSSSIPPSASQVRMQGPSVAVKYAAGWETLRLSANFTMVGAAAETGNLDGGAAITDDITLAVTRFLPAVMLVEPSGPTRLAYAIVPTRVGIYELSHQSVSCTYTLTADKTVAVALPGNSTAMFVGVRSVALELRADAEVEEPYEYSGTNQLFHRSQDVLQRRTTAGRFRITGVDLRQFLDGAAPLALGQMVRIRSSLVDVPLRVVSLDYTMGSAEVLNLEAGDIAPTLTGVTVSL